MTLTLERMVQIKYGNVNAFAEAAGRDIKLAKRLLNQAANLTREEIQLLIRLLEIPTVLVAPQFFGTMFANEESIAAEELWIAMHRGQG